MAIELLQPRITVVALGSFQPDLAIPQKLTEGGAVSSDDIDSVEYNALVPGQAVDYSLGWCRINVVLNRFSVETSVPPFVKAADLIQKTIADVMPLSVVDKLGINLQYTMRFESSEERDEFGFRLSPPSSWGAWGQKIEQGVGKSPKRHGGVVVLTMREIPIEGRDAGWRDVQVVAGANETEAYMVLLDHFDSLNLKTEGLEPRELAQRRTTGFMRILADQFDKSVNDLETIARDVIKGST